MDETTTRPLGLRHVVTLSPEQVADWYGSVMDDHDEIQERRDALKGSAIQEAYWRWCRGTLVDFPLILICAPMRDHHGRLVEDDSGRMVPGEVIERYAPPVPMSSFLVHSDAEPTEDDYESDTSRWADACPHSYSGQEKTNPTIVARPRPRQAGAA